MVRVKLFQMIALCFFLMTVAGNLVCPVLLGTHEMARAGSESDSVSAAWEPPQLRQAARPITEDVFYFLLLDRFANGDSGNDRGGESAPLSGETQSDRLRHGFWPSRPSFYHGGDLKGLTGRLGYLQKLGVTALWLSPVMKNLPVQHTERGKDAVAGYHGYYITDFTTVDPHLGTEDDLRSLVSEAHRRDMKVILDIVVNHTADVIRYKECNPCSYRSTSEHPDSTYTPFIPPGFEGIKKPAWLNDPRFYNNRGNSTFSGESSVLGDFHELDDLRTSDPEVVRGMIDIYSAWIRRFHIDGFRLDTVKHVEPSFWRAFVPAVKKVAAEAGIPDFFVFGEVYSSEVAVLSEQALAGRLDSVLDFATQGAVRAMATAQIPSRSNADGNTGADFGRPYAETLEQDDQYRTGFSPQHLMTFLSNHDVGRMGGFLKESAVPEALWLPRMTLAHAVLFFGRGVPIVYYGDEQGFVGTGPDTGARQDMWATRDPVGRIGASPDQPSSAFAPFNDSHPLYTALAAFGRARRQIPALQSGEQLPLQRGEDFLAPPTVQAFRRALPSGHGARSASTHTPATGDVMVFLNWGEDAAQVKLSGAPQVLFAWPSPKSQGGSDGAQLSNAPSSQPVAQAAWRGSLDLPPSSVAVVHVSRPAQASGLTKGTEGGVPQQNRRDGTGQNVEPDWSALALAGLSANERVSGRVAVRINVPQPLKGRIRTVDFSCFLEAPQERAREGSGPAPAPPAASPSQSPTDDGSLSAAQIEVCSTSGVHLAADPTPPFQAFVDVRGIRNGTPIRIEARVFADTGQGTNAGSTGPVRTLSVPLVVDDRLPFVSVLYANPLGATHVQLIADNGLVGVLENLQLAARARGAGSLPTPATERPSVPGAPPGAAVPGRSRVAEALSDLQSVTHAFRWPRGARSVQLTYVRLSAAPKSDASKGTSPLVTLEQIDRPVTLRLDEHVFPRAQEDAVEGLPSIEQPAVTLSTSAQPRSAEPHLWARILVDAWGSAADPDASGGGSSAQLTRSKPAQEGSGAAPAASAPIPLPLRPLVLGSKGLEQGPSGTGAVTRASAFWAGLFVRGGMNGWEARDRLVPVPRTALAETQLNLPVGRVEFKIADKDWSAQSNFGAPVGASGFVSSGQSGNLYLNIEPGQEGTHRFFFGLFGADKKTADNGLGGTQTPTLQLFVIRDAAADQVKRSRR